jgi:hypothetical protein
MPKSGGGPNPSASPKPAMPTTPPKGVPTKPITKGK